MTENQKRRFVRAKSEWKLKTPQIWPYTYIYWLVTWRFACLPTSGPCKVALLVPVQWKGSFLYTSRLICSLIILPIHNLIGIINTVPNKDYDINLNRWVCSTKKNNWCDIYMVYPKTYILRDFKSQLWGLHFTSDIVLLWSI